MHFRLVLGSFESHIVAIFYVLDENIKGLYAPQFIS